MKVSLSAVLAITLLLMPTTSKVASSQEETSVVVCGQGTYLNQVTNECLPLNNNNNSPQQEQEEEEDPNVITLAGILDTTTYTWSPEIFEATVNFINQGGWDVLPPFQNMSVSHQLENGACDETTAARQYWKLRTRNGHRPMHGLLGARCSGASMTLARLSGLERVPQLSPVSNAAQLSNDQEFPYFSRLVAPNNEHGEGTKQQQQQQQQQ